MHALSTSSAIQKILFTFPSGQLINSHGLPYQHRTHTTKEFALSNQESKTKGVIVNLGITPKRTPHGFRVFAQCGSTTRSLCGHDVTHIPFLVDLVITRITDAIEKNGWVLKGIHIRTRKMSMLPQSPVFVKGRKHYVRFSPSKIGELKRSLVGG